MEEFKDAKQEFAQSYMSNLKENVIPVVRKFEKERKLRFALAILIAVIIGITAISVVAAFLIFSNGHLKSPIVKFAIWIFGFAAFFWYKIQKSFEYKIKNEIMPTLISAFDGFKWIDIAPDEYYDDILDSCIFPFIPDRKITHSYNDYFYGSYSNVNIDFSQAYYETEKVSFKRKYEFSGGVIRIQMNKNFEGYTILRPKSAPCDELKKMDLEKIVLEDLEFNKMYNIYSTDQVEARYLLTPTFMEKLKNIAHQFDKTSKIYCAFKDNTIYIAPESKNPMFELFGLSKRVDNISKFHTLFTQIASVIDLINYLKLDRRIGL